MKKYLIVTGILLVFFTVVLSGCTETEKTDVKITNVDIQHTVDGSHHNFVVTSTFKNVGNEGVDVGISTRLCYNNKLGYFDTDNDNIYLDVGDSITKTTVLEQSIGPSVKSLGIEVKASNYDSYYKSYSLYDWINILKVTKWKNI